MKKLKSKKGALSRQLGIPERENIPSTLLDRISSARVGTKIANPTEKGNRTFKVTKLLKKRVVLARTFKRRD